MDPELLEQIERARGMTGAEKVRESLQLYDRSRRMIMDGLRSENPGADDAVIRQLFIERLQLNRSMEVLLMVAQPEEAGPHSRLASTGLPMGARGALTEQRSMG